MPWLILIGRLCCATPRPPVLFGLPTHRVPECRSLMCLPPGSTGEKREVTLGHLLSVASEELPFSNETSTKLSQVSGAYKMESEIHPSPHASCICRSLCVFIGLFTLPARAGRTRTSGSIVLRIVLHLASLRMPNISCWGQHSGLG